MYLDERWVERQSWLPLTCAPSIRIGKTGGMAGHPIATKEIAIPASIKAEHEEIHAEPLGLLAPLARGETSQEMRAVLPLTDSLKAELPRMLEEHKAIHAATVRLGEIARTENNPAAAELAKKLALHAQSEEEVFYPAAILVGDMVRARVR